MEVELAGKSYAGVIPCADCQGIAYEVNFYANSQFESISMYIGKSNEKFVEEGTWRVVQDSTIALTSQEGDERSLKLKDGHLLMLDREDNEIKGQLASRYILRNTKTHPVEGSLESGESDTAIAFKAHGNEPFWALEIDRNRMISFHMMSGDSLLMPIPEMEIDSAAAVKTYRAQTEEGSLYVALHPIGCIDSMSGQVYDFRVKVTKNGEEYSGCGGPVSEIDTLGS